GPMYGPASAAGAPPVPAPPAPVPPAPLPPAPVVEAPPVVSVPPVVGVPFDPVVEPAGGEPVVLSLLPDAPGACEHASASARSAPLRRFRTRRQLAADVGREVRRFDVDRARTLERVVIVLCIGEGRRFQYRD